MIGDLLAFLLLKKSVIESYFMELLWINTFKKLKIYKY
jgi:hypothetical protein